MSCDRKARQTIFGFKGVEFFVNLSYVFQGDKTQKEMYNGIDSIQESEKYQTFQRNIANVHDMFFLGECMLVFVACLF